MANETNKLSKVHRQQKIFNYLKHLTENSALSIHDIHQKLMSEGFDLIQKTVARDIDEMSETFKLQEMGENPVRFYASSDFKPDFELTFTQEELQTITMALESLKQTSPNYLGKLCLEAQNTLETKVPAKLYNDLIKFKNMHIFHYGINGRAVARDDKSFALAMRALRNGFTIKCKNFSPYKDEEYNQRIRHFAPLAFLLSGGIPFIYVRDMDDNGLKTLRLTRLTEVKITKEPVEPMKKESIKNLDHAFGGFGLGFSNEDLISYEIHCTGEVATYFTEREIHSEQRIEKISSDHFIITFSLPDSREIIRLLAGFGAEIHKILPVPIEQKVFDILRSKKGQLRQDLFKYPFQGSLSQRICNIIQKIVQKAHFFLSQIYGHFECFFQLIFSRRGEDGHNNTIVK